MKTLIFGIGLLAKSVLAGSFSTPNVNLVSSTDFQRDVLGSEKATMVAFFAPWCGHCKNLAPEYDKAAKNMKGLVNYAAIDCDQQANKAICGQYGIQGFPTLKLFPGKPRTSPRGGSKKNENYISKSWQDYNGQRSAKDLADYTAEQMPSHVKKLKTSKDITDLVEGTRSKPVAILFTKSTLVTPLYKGLSVDFHHDMDLYAVRDTADIKEAKEKFGVEKIPTLLVFRSGESSPQLFKGSKLNYENLHTFMRGFTEKPQSHSEL